MTLRTFLASLVVAVTFFASRAESGERRIYYPQHNQIVVQPCQCHEINYGFGDGYRFGSGYGWGVGFGFGTGYGYGTGFSFNGGSAGGYTAGYRHW